MAKKGPCWEGYEMIGMKTKNGRKVPNCVKKATQGAYLGKAVRQPTETDREFSVRKENVNNFSCGGMGHAIRGGKFEGVR